MLTGFFILYTIPRSVLIDISRNLVHAKPSVNALVPTTDVTRTPLSFQFMHFGEGYQDTETTAIVIYTAIFSIFIFVIAYIFNKKISRF